MSKWTERISPPILTFSVYRSKFDSVYRSAFIERINGIERRSFLIQFNKPVPSRLQRFVLIFACLREVHFWSQTRCGGKRNLAQ